MSGFSSRISISESGLRQICQQPQYVKSCGEDILEHVSSHFGCSKISSVLFCYYASCYSIRQLKDIIRE